MPGERRGISGGGQGADLHDHKICFRGQFGVGFQLLPGFRLVVGNQFLFREGQSLGLTAGPEYFRVGGRAAIRRQRQAEFVRGIGVAGDAIEKGSEL